MRTNATRRWALSVACLALVACIPGCGHAGADLAPVTGSVSYRGAPLEKGRIILYPATGRPAYGDIVGGKIQNVTTKQPGDGATVGLCTVGIVAASAGGSMYSPGKAVLPPQFGDPAKSKLTADIRAGEPNELVFDLRDPEFGK